jgi:hypothetical protein
MSSSGRITKLKLKIAEAFNNVKLKNEIVIEHDCDECWELDKTFSEFKSWKEVPKDAIVANYNKLSFFNSEAFHCFLPAYLLYALDHTNEFDEVYDFCCYGFMLRENESAGQIQWKKERYLYFNEIQLKLVSDFIDVAIENEDFEDFIAQLKRGKNLINEIIKNKTNDC